MSIKNKYMWDLIKRKQAVRGTCITKSQYYMCTYVCMKAYLLFDLSINWSEYRCDASGGACFVRAAYITHVVGALAQLKDRRQGNMLFQ